MDDLDEAAESDATLIPRLLRSSDYRPPDQRQMMASLPSWFIPPPYGWRHPVTGRHGWLSDPLLLAFGQYVKRGRYLARKTQQAVADEARVDQGQLSRLERALAPSMRVDKLVRLGNALGRAFPLGYCPHEHWCVWQPAPKPPPEEPFDRLVALRELLNPQSGSDDPNDDGDGPA
jgi:transcriptional regulator with XRE-family HTH domain